jgi:hypothetical protein
MAGLDTAASLECYSIFLAILDRILYMLSIVVLGICVNPQMGTNSVWEWGAPKWKFLVDIGLVERPFSTYMS